MKFRRKGWRLDNAELTLKVVDLEKRISSIEKERIGKGFVGKIEALEKRIEELERFAEEIKKL